MLERKYRLKKSSAFTATYRIRHSYFKSGIALWVGKQKTEEYPTKVAFVVSKKTHKRAVKRNRLKRLMREAYRLLLKKNQITNSQQYMSLIFVGHEKALNQTFDQIKMTVNELLNGIKDVN